MPTFTPITTQEELDRIVGEQVTARTTALDTEIKTLKASALRHKVAHDKGLPYEMAARLTGETEEELGRDADTLVGFFKSNQPPAPPASHEPPVGDSKKTAYKTMAAGLVPND